MVNQFPIRLKEQQTMQVALRYREPKLEAEPEYNKIWPATLLTFEDKL